MVAEFFFFGKKGEMVYFVLVLFWVWVLKPFFWGLKQFEVVDLFFDVFFGECFVLLLKVFLM